jgi:pantoate--beta-alanine ligase
MIIFKHIKDISNYLSGQQKKGRRIGFVPTMGALHQGHISLINSCNKKNDITVCSIFINPTQFNNSKDFDKYPVTIEQDIDFLEKNECDVLFLPSTKEIYPPDYPLTYKYDLGYIETILEGKFRPGHFQGVCQVMQRLLEIIHPQQLFLGQKDYQQCMVISKLIAISKMPVEIIIEPTLREKDGLAMSSRNMRLKDEERIRATKIFETLSFIKNEIKAGNLQNLTSKAMQLLQNNGFIIDYVEIADATNLSIQEYWDGNTKIVALIAASLNDVRLIDNMILN